MSCPHCAKRSDPHHRRFFKLIALAYLHWPSGYKDFQPTSPEHLRAWLLVQCGYRKEAEIQIRATIAPNTVQLIEAVMRAAGSYVWIQTQEDRMVVLSPKSIAYDKLGRKAFGALAQAVEILICHILKIETGDTLLKWHRRAA